MFRIGEFSKLTQVSIRMLRYYDEAGLLKPAKTDPFTGYRLYSADQIAILNKIIFLRDTGFLISEIAELIHQWDETHVLKKLDAKQTEIQSVIEKEQNKINQLEIARHNIINGISHVSYNITIKSIPSYQVLSLRRVIPDYYSEGQLCSEMYEFVQSSHIAISEQTFSIYHDPEYKETDVDVELCALTDQTSSKFVTCCHDSSSGFSFRLTEAVPTMACTMVYGTFDHIAGAFLSFAGWLEENDRFEMMNTSRQIVHRGPWNEKNPDQYLTELQIPLRLK